MPHSPSFFSQVAIPTILKAQAAYYMGMGKSVKGQKKGELSYLSQAK